MVKTLVDRKPKDRFHGLIYGDSGAGKTHLIGTFPSPYIIDTDFGLDTLAGKDIEYEEYYARIGQEGASEAWPAVLDKAEEFVKNPPRDTLAIDSLTTLFDSVIAYVLNKAKRNVLQIQDYMTIYDEITTLIVKLRKVPCHVLVTAHEEVYRDELSGRINYRPLVIGNKFSPKLPIFFNNIYNIVVDIPKKGDRVADRRLLVQPDGQRLAKTQSDLRPDEIKIEKNFDAIMAHIGGK